ncbi:MAG: PEP/pyruvate-binding domain-containing protein [Halobacteriaceae archaeon]
MTATSRFALPLDDERARDPALTGGKGSNLARLVAAGFPVPPGFCVTTPAYEAVADDPSVRAAVESLDALDPGDAAAIAAASETARAAVRARDLPAEVRRAVAGALDDLGGDAYAVRSSATAEDLPGASFAGQHETFLGVRDRDAVVERVRDCLAGLFTDRAVTYRLRNGVSNASVAMAVVVQELVDPDVAGVLFTADPVSGNRRVASVDANFGLGETVVAGEVSPDSARVDRRTGEVDYEVGEKRRARRPSERGGTEAVELDPERRGSRALSDARLRALVDLGARVEQLLGGPQDVEWALVDGAFVLLQSRPVTSLFPLPSPPPADDALHVYLSFGHAQAMPEALPPLVADFWRGFLEGGAAAFLGEDVRGRWAVEAGGRVYLDLTGPLGVPLLGRRLPGRLEAVNEPAADALRDLLDRRRESFPERGRLASARALAGAVRDARPLLRSVVPGLSRRVAGGVLFGPPDPDAERAWVEGWGRAAAARVRDPATLAGRVRAAFERVDFSLVVADLFPRVGAHLLASVAARRLLARLVPGAEADLDAVGKGFEAELVTRMNQRLGDLADVAREHPEVRAALRRGRPLPEVEAAAGGREFAAALEGFLDEFGHRASGEIDLRRPRWRDDPGTLLRTLRGDLARDEPGAHRDHLAGLERDAAAAADRLAARADRGLLGPVRRALVRRLIRTYRGGIQLREYPKQGIAHLFAAVHEELSAAGEALAADGRLDDPDDVWFLREGELLAALAEGAPVEADVEARRRAHDRNASMAAPPLLTSEGEAPTAARSGSGTVLAGTPVSSGVVEGPARVVRDPTSETLEKGEILVAPSTDPGWTPLFLNAAGLVMEVGGRMTHGALVAREYGLPAVAAVTGATGTIRSGERVRVDGTRGTVELLDRD